jgi:hypothetical protein
MTPDLFFFRTFYREMLYLFEFPAGRAPQEVVGFFWLDADRNPSGRAAAIDLVSQYDERCSDRILCA